jgi:hypothetical protein
MACAGGLTDHIAQLVDEFRRVQELELPFPVRPETVGAPDVLLALQSATNA